MHFATVFSLACAVVGTQAATVPLEARVSKIADFRAYTEVGCPFQSGGIFTILSDKLGCHEFGKYLPDKSVFGVQGVGIKDNCTMNAYADDACAQGGTPMALDECVGRDNGEAWRSFKVSC